jgi:hypothetical protein
VSTEMASSVNGTSAGQLLKTPRTFYLKSDRTSISVDASIRAFPWRG